MRERRRRKHKEFFKYECSISGKTYQLTKKAQNPDELIYNNAHWMPLPKPPKG